MWPCVSEVAFETLFSRGRVTKEAAVGLGNMVKVPALAVPQLAPCASSARAWRLRAAQGRDQATGRPATASVAQASCLQSRRFHCLLEWNSTQIPGLLVLASTADGLAGEVWRDLAASSSLEQADGHVTVM